MKTAAHDSESEIKKPIKELLRRCGWVVFDTADSRVTRRQLASLPDLIAFRHDCTLLIEAKSATGRPRPGQIEFGCRIAPHLGQHLHYCVAKSLDDLPKDVFVLP